MFFCQILIQIKSLCQAGSWHFQKEPCERAFKSWVGIIIDRQPPPIKTINLAILLQMLLFSDRWKTFKKAS